MPSCILWLRKSLRLTFFPFLYLFFSFLNKSPATYMIESFYLVLRVVFRLTVTKSNEEWRTNLSVFVLSCVCWPFLLTMLSVLWLLTYFSAAVQGKGFTLAVWIVSDYYNLGLSLISFSRHYFVTDLQEKFYIWLPYISTTFQQQQIVLWHWEWIFSYLFFLILLSLRLS